MEYQTYRLHLVGPWTKDTLREEMRTNVCTYNLRIVPSQYISVD